MIAALRRGAPRFAGWPERRRSPRTWWSDYAFRLTFAWSWADWEPLEVMLGITALLWGGWLLAVYGAWQVGWTVRDAMASNPAYGPMRLVASAVGFAGSVFWGMLALGLGALSVAGFVSNRTRWRLAGMLGLGLFWTFAAICYVAADWRTTASVSVPCYAAAALYVYRRLDQSALDRRVRAAQDRAEARRAIDEVDALGELAALTATPPLSAPPDPAPGVAAPAAAGGEASGA